MNWKFKLSKRMALSKVAVLFSAAAISACAADRSLTDPATPSQPIDPAVVASIAVSPKADSVGAGATTQITATVRDAQGATLAGQGVTWVSTNESVAAVTATGLVTAGASGTAQIIASIAGRADTSMVTVSASAAPQQPAQPSGPHAGYHVSPSGTSGGDGSASQPWDLRTALAGGNGRVQAGDTVWMHAGTYTGSFRATVSGQSGRPVVFRQYPGERAIVDGAGTPGGAQSVFYVGGSYVEFWDFEITNSDGGRTTGSTANNVRPNVVANYASHTKYINMVVHDGGVAFYNEPAYSDVEITGCLIYNNGWQGPDRGHGHALYLKSDGGQVIARENVIFNQFGYGVHLYSNPGSGHLNNITISGNVAFNNGTLSSNSNSANILFGQGETSTGGVMKDNMTYYSPNKGAKNVVAGGDAVAQGSLAVSDNYFTGGSTVLSFGTWSSLSLTNNTLIGTATLTSGVSGTSGLSLFNSLPGATKVFVRPSPREAGRANIVVYNWGGQGSVTVNLAGIVPAGARYEIRNAQNFYGAPVATGTGGGSATLSLAGVSAPAVVGMGSVGTTTGSQFQVFIVTVVG